MPGERISPNAIVRSSNTMKVPFGETLGVPSGAAVATKPSRCSSMTRLISGVNMPSRLNLELLRFVKLPWQVLAGNVRLGSIPLKKAAVAAQRYQ